MNFLKELLKEFLRPLNLLLGKSTPSDPLVTIRRLRPNVLSVCVRIPGRIEPLERNERFEDPLQEALDAEELGEVTGGGTQLSAPDTAGRQEVEYCEIELELYETGRGLPLLRRELARLRVPRGTVLVYELNGNLIELPVYES